MASLEGSLSHLLPPDIDDMISRWLREDCPAFDYGGFVVGDEIAEAKLLGKDEGVLAGAPFVDRIFQKLDCKYADHIVHAFFIPWLTSREAHDGS